MYKSDNDIYQLYTDKVSSSYPEYLKRLGIENIAVEASGIYITDSNGKHYIDCTCGYGIFNLGHNNPDIIKSVIDVLKSNKLMNRTFINNLQVEVADAIEGVTPDELTCSYLCNSGSEAVDSALKLARLVTRKKRIIAAKGSFHGYTCGAMSVTGIDKFRRMFGPLLPDVTFVEYGDIEDLTKNIDDDVAAVILEPMQHEAGIDIPEPGYFSKVSLLCEKHNALFILDEVKTGFGKTGDFFACNLFEIPPDILVLGKSIGGGVIPAGAIVTKKKYWKQFSLSFPMSASSNAGNSLACAAAKKTIEILSNSDLLNVSRQTGDILKSELEIIKKKFPGIVTSVRGKGLLFGIEVLSPKHAYEILKQFIKSGVFAMPCFGSANVIMIEPPLIITREQVSLVVDVIDKSIANIKESLH